MTLSKMFQGLITVAVGLALLGPVRGFVDAALPNSTAGEAAILGLVTFLWVIGVLAAAAAIAGVKIGGKR